MRVALVSDVHLEFGFLDIRNTENADVLVLSGDIMIAQTLHDHPEISSESVNPPKLGVRQVEALRYARCCYDHLAGELGVRIAVTLENRGLIASIEPGKRVDVTLAGVAWFEAVFGFDVRNLKPGRHGLACRCLDWTERRYHLAGPLGTRLLQRYFELGWLRRTPQSRAVRLTQKGRDSLQAQLGIGSPAS